MLSNHSTRSTGSCATGRAEEQLRILYRRRLALNRAIAALERYCALTPQRPETGPRRRPFLRPFKSEP